MVTGKLQWLTFFTSKLKHSVQGELVKQAIVLLHEVGYKVVALVLNGLSGNVRMVQEFGCCLDVNLVNSFPNPLMNLLVSV